MHFNYKHSKLESHLNFSWTGLNYRFWTQIFNINTFTFNFFEIWAILNCKSGTETSINWVKCQAFHYFKPFELGFLKPNCCLTSVCQIFSTRYFEICSAEVSATCDSLKNYTGANNGNSAKYCIENWLFWSPVNNLLNPFSMIWFFCKNVQLLFSESFHWT